MALVATTVLAACGGIELGTGSGFQANYFSARSALEAGKFSVAVNRYDMMLADAGPLETRLRLEKAHALLRADNYPAAAQEARVVAAAHRDSRRAAALAVLGTAEHRMAQEAMSAGNFSSTTVAHLQQAKAALSEMLSTAPDLDPLGAMAERLTMIETSLSNLGG